jgi:hypothetical protein
VKPLAAPDVDTSDKTGATALIETPASFGNYYPTGPLAIQVNGTSYTDHETNGVGLDEDQKFLMISATVKNLDTGKLLLRYDTFNVQLLDTDGSEIDRENDLLRASSDRPIDTELNPGQEMKFRFYFRVDQDITPRTLMISAADDSRTYKYEMPN